MRESARYTAVALCLLVLALLGPSCSIDQLTSTAVGSDAGGDVGGAGGSGGFGDGAAGWAGYGASGGAPACGANTKGTSAISDLQFVYHAFQTILGRAPDPAGFEFRVNELADGAVRPAVYAALAATKELADDPGLQDKAGFVERVYGVLLGRPPTESELGSVVPLLKKFDGKGPGSITWYEEFVSVLETEEYASIARPLIGVHFPMPVDPTVALTDADFIRHAYLAILDREYDVPGISTYMSFLETNSRPMLFDAMVTGPEFGGNTALHSKESFVTRVYDAVLGRAPTQPENDAALKDLAKFDGTGGSTSWYELYLSLIQSEEFKTKNCPSEYWVYDAPIATDSPLLRDVANATARIQTPQDATLVTLTFDAATGAGPSAHEKLVTFVDPKGELYAFGRGLLPDQTFNVFLFRAQDPAGTSFAQIGAGLFAKNATENYLDPQLAIDNTVCPRRYVLGTLCPAGACISYTTTPTVTETWSRPRPMLSNCVPNTPDCGERYVSLASSITLFDHRRAYFGWAELDDGATPYLSGTFVNPDDGVESVSTNAHGFDPYAPDFETVFATPKQSLLAAEPNPKCTSAWDCDNRWISDWRAEGAYYYMLYAGANYHRCKRPDMDAALTNQWGIGLASSQVAVSNYSRPADSSVILSEVSNTCGMSYPVVNQIGEKLYVYYASYDTSGTSSLWRAAIDCQ